MRFCLVGVAALAASLTALSTASATEHERRPIVTAAATLAPEADEWVSPTARSLPRLSETAGDNTLTIVFGGDLGLGGSNERLHPEGALRHGKRHAWADLTAGIAPLINGDLNFANLETVVTDRDTLGANPKLFNFKSHPAGVRHLVGLGFNVFSTANNHALDYGEEGVRETVRHLEALEARGLKAWPGVGLSREQASRPSDVLIKNARVRISAIGIGGNGLSADDGQKRQRAGMLAYSQPQDIRETVARLAEADGDLRVLSVHYGAELQVRPSASDIAKLRDQAVRAQGIDIVVGHHAHVPAGVQMVDGKLVLYGLGNLLHPGMQDMGRFDMCRDYGLFVRVHLAKGASGRMETRAIEAIPLTDMHLKAQPLLGDEGRLRIEVLNHLASDLDEPRANATGVRFVARPDGSGLYCTASAASEPGRIGALCKGWEAPTPPSREIARRIANACGTDIIARRKPSEPSAIGVKTSRSQSPVRQAQKEAAAGRSFWSFFTD